MTATSPPPRAIGELCIAGDRASTTSDLDGLREVAQQLAVLLPGPIHRELVRVVEATRIGPEHATACWCRVRDRLYRSA